MYNEDEWYDDNVCSDCGSHYDDWGYCPFCDGLWATYSEPELDEDDDEDIDYGNTVYFGLEDEETE